MKSSRDFNVDTVSGKSISRDKCRFINGKYYEMNIDCFLMPDNKWHRIDNGKIVFDNEKGFYVLLDQVYLQEGIIDINADGSFKYGYFSPNPIKNILINDVPCISEDVIKGIEVKENLSSGSFYTKENWNSRMNKKGITRRYSFDLDYSAGPKIKMFSEAHRENYVVKHNYRLNRSFINQLGSTTFGFEIETDNGQIPERQLFKNGLIPLRDGSLKHGDIEPFEYTTIPLSGETGVNTIIDIMDLVVKYTEISKRCALHLHIGGYKPSKEFLLSLHRVMLKVQDEVFSLFPSNYKFTSENGFKSKDYCAPIQDFRLLKKNTVDQNFELLFNHYSGGHSRFVDFGYCGHPKDEGNRAKWQIPERYRIQNCIPLIWGKSSTCEYRPHVPTQNIHKVLNWLFICNAIMKYAFDNQTGIANFGDIKNLNLDHILKTVYSADLANVLMNYIQWRKDYMHQNDATGSQELENDLATPPFSILL